MLKKILIKTKKKPSLKFDRNCLDSRFTFPLTSSIWWSVKRPFLAADESWTSAIILPFLKWKPMFPELSLCMVTVRSRGLEIEQSKFRSTFINLHNFLILKCRSFVLPVTNDNSDSVDRGVTEYFMDFLHAVTGDGSSIDFKNLITESKPSNGSRRIWAHETHEDSTIHRVNSQADFSVLILAER